MEPNNTESNLNALKLVGRRYGWLKRIRPQSLAEPLYKLFGPYERRAIINWRGTSLYIDPFSHLGWCILNQGEYENAMCSLIENTLKPGSVFFDIGANEGIFSAMAARIVGADGLVVAVEPQSRLVDILAINIALNSSGPYRIIRSAIGETDGASVSLSLGPLSNTGGSSIVRKYRWSRRNEVVTTRRLDDIVEQIEGRQIDLVKIDVEGFEFEVVKSAKNALSQGKITTLAVDFHISHLKERDISPEEINEFICEAGYRADNKPKGGYVIYTRLTS